MNCYESPWEWHNSHLLIEFWPSWTHHHTSNIRYKEIWLHTGPIVSFIFLLSSVSKMETAGGKIYKETTLDPHGGPEQKGSSCKNRT